MFLRRFFLTLALISLPIFGWFIWHTWNTESTIHTLIASQEKAGESILSDLQTLPTLPMAEEQDSFIMKDDTSDGISIQFANQEDSFLGEQDKKDPFTLSFPKDYTKPVEIKLDKDRSIRITDQSNTSFSSSLLSTDAKEKPDTLEKDSFLTTIKKTLGVGKQELPKTFLSYQSDDERKTLLYAYQKDQGTGEKKLKHWTLYQKGNGLESESYKIEGAKVKIQDGVAQVFYFGDQDLKNQEAQAQVEPSLMERAQRTLAKEMGEDILHSNKTPDFTIPKPYYIDREGTKTETDWKWDEEKQILSLSFSVDQTKYPIALDPTLSFTAPGMSNTGEVITGEANNDLFGWTSAAGDFNNDGKIDLVVGAMTYATNYGRAYIFYQDGGVATQAVNADVAITGEAGSYFGCAIATGDFNNDGKTDLAIGGYTIAGTGRTYVFYNDGSMPTTGASADAIITGEASSGVGYALTSGDYNNDGKIDLAMSAHYYSTNTGRVYVFYNASITTRNASTADAIITGETTSNYFGVSMISGDFNRDGKTDLVVGAFGYSTNTGRAYVFYNASITTRNASTADAIITGEASPNYFGWKFAAGDFNNDGKTDLAVGAIYYSTSTGRTYLFYNGSITTENASGADVIITGETTNNYFGSSMVADDFNQDGKTDLAIGAHQYSSNTGRAYIFYNSSLTTRNASIADVIITGETTSSSFGVSMTSGDFNQDGKVDLSVGARDYMTSTGRAYIFYSQNGQVNMTLTMTGEDINNVFGGAMVAGDFNADGKTDLAVGARDYNFTTGRAYVFYNDGSMSTTAATADAIITGQAGSNYLGEFIAAGDWNADGKTDLAVGARGYSTNIGRAYLFYNGSITTENASGADVIITGETWSNEFGTSFAAGDWNADGKVDLAVGARGYSTSTGRTYIFYNGSITTENASGADVIITGEATNNAFSASMTTGDFNNDGKTDLAVGAHAYSTSTGRTYIFYNGSITTENASGADVIITGETTNNAFGGSMATGDVNSDGKIDLIVAAWGYSTNTGRVYVFYNASITTRNASTADVIITGETTNNYFGSSVVSSDWNADGRVDFAVKAYGYNTNTSRFYLFYNDGSLPTAAVNADVIITGEATNSYMSTICPGDFNGDGRMEFALGVSGYSNYTGRVYFYEIRENFAWKLQSLSDSTGLRTGTNSTGQEMRITGETGTGQFGTSMISGDFNTDGKIDLAVGAAITGRTYIFYSDGSLSPSASSADVIITGEHNSHYFGNSLTSGDFNADGRTDLAVGAFNTYRTYIFYNDGSIPITAATADVIITGDSSSYFGYALTSGDFNADGRTDLAVGAHVYSTSTGRVYIFYNDGSIPTTSATADVTITGETTNNEFGHSMVAGDFNADGRTDLVVSAWKYSSNTGRVYLFYNDGSIPTTAATADVTITGGASESLGQFGLVSGDFNADGRTDLGVLGVGTGKVFLFYNDGSIPTTSATADVTITGFSVLSSVTSGDWNADGRTDLAVGDVWPAGGDYTGRAYVFYNDGSIPTTMATADVTLSGQSAGGYFGNSLVSGDFNADGKTDLAVGAYRYASDTGRVYVYTFNDPVITGEATNNYFGQYLTSGDFNADGRTDLAVGAYGYSSSTGRVYIFYNDGSIPTTAATADVIITGTASSSFGSFLAAGDVNADGKTDLLAVAGGNSAVHIFYNDGSYTGSSATADVTISGGNMGDSVSVGDLNTDGKVDILVAASGYGGHGRAYLYYADGTNNFGSAACTGSLPTTCTSSNADIIVDGASGARLSRTAIGDVNADGRADMLLGGTNSTPGYVYVLYNDGVSFGTAACTTACAVANADVTITGEGSSDGLSSSLQVGDFNADGRIDIVAGAESYSANTGRVYIFYNDGSYPSGAGSADVIVTGSVGSARFGKTLIAGDFNADGRTDFAVGMVAGAGVGSVTYIFYNDGSYPTTAATADVRMTGEAFGDGYEPTFAMGDFNADGRVDLAMGAWAYSSRGGKVYIYTTEAKAVPVSAYGSFVRGGVKLRGGVKVK